MVKFGAWLTLPAILALGVVWSCGGGGSGGGNVSGPLTAQTVVDGISFPTALRFTPDGRILYTEKSTGSIRVIENGQLVATPFATVGVDSGGEQGLLGLAIDPNFASNGFVYVYHTQAGGATNRVVRFTTNGNVGANPTPIVTNLPSASNHVGGRIAFGPDGKLYVTLGDVLDPANAQNNASPAGKVLRYNPDGSIPNDNPIPGNPLFTKGHRNCFGLCIDPVSGTVFVSENGPNCDDEVNRLQPGGNYGWRPGQPCGDNDPAYLRALQSFSSVIAPTGMTVGTNAFAGSLLMASFNDRSLRQLKMSNLASGSVEQVVKVYSHLTNFVIDVTIGPDGNPYIATGDNNGTGSILRLVR